MKDTNAFADILNQAMITTGIAEDFETSDIDASVDPFSRKQMSFCECVFIINTILFNFMCFMNKQSLQEILQI